MRPVDGIAALLALGTSLSLGSLGSYVANKATDPIPSIVHAFEVSSGKYGRPPARDPVAMPMVEHPDSDSVLWINIVPLRPEVMANPIPICGPGPP